MRQIPFVFTTTAYAEYGRKLCEHRGFEAGELERITFPDGERYLRFDSKVRGRDVVLIGGTIDDRHTLELYDMACGLSALGVNRLTLVVPYFGYSTMERACHEGEVVTAKNRALLLSSIPRARLCNEIVMIDLHTAGIAHYFEDHLHPYHLSAMALAGEIVTELSGDEPVVLASTDAGRAKWVEALANRLSLPAAFVYKRRLSGEHTEIAGVNADVAGKHVVIYDDMIRTGGSLIKAARAYQQGGAVKISAITTHGVLPGDALERIERSGLFAKVVATDTYPHAEALAEQSLLLEVRSSVPAVAAFLEELTL